MKNNNNQNNSVNRIPVNPSMRIPVNPSMRFPHNPITRMPYNPMSRLANNSNGFFEKFSKLKNLETNWNSIGFTKEV